MKWNTPLLQQLPPRPWWDRTAYALLLILIVWAPLPLGSNRPWALAVLGLGAWLALLVWLGGAATQAATQAAVRPWGRLAAGGAGVAVLAGFALLTAAQLAGHAGAPWAGVLATLDDMQTRTHLYTTLVYLAVFALVLATAGRPGRVRGVLATVAASGVLQAALAVLLQATGAHYQLFFTTFDQGGRATGTYPNPDHLAGYMELGLSAGVGLLLTQMRGGGGAAHWRHWLLGLMQFLLSPKMLVRLTMLLMVVALVMTHSRMGNAAFFVTLLLVGLLVAARSRALRQPALWLVASMALVDLVVVGQWVGLERVAQRVAGSIEATQAQLQEPVFGDGALAPPPREQSLQERLALPQAALPLVWQRPWFGHGGGTFVLAMPAVKPPGFPHYWDHAHNDYVEIAVDTGLVGLGLLLALAVATLWRAWPALADAPQPTDDDRLKRGVAVAAWMALSCMALHGLVDFNLQIPANAMTLVVLVALVWAGTGGGAKALRQAREDANAPEGSVQK